MGVSIALYFRFIKYLAFLFLTMSIIAFPILYFCRAGANIAKEDVDPVQLNLWTLGNVNQTRSLFFGVVLTAKQASLVISMCDVGYSLLFLVFIAFWKRRIASVVADIDEGHVTPSDYTVRAPCHLLMS